MNEISEELKKGITLSIHELMGNGVEEGHADNARYYAFVACPNEKQNVLFVQLRTPDNNYLQHNGKKLTSIRIPMDVDQDDDCYFGDRDGDILTYHMGDCGYQYLSVNAHQYDGMDILFAVKQIIVDAISLIEEQNA